MQSGLCAPRGAGAAMQEARSAAAERPWCEPAQKAADLMEGDMGGCVYSGRRRTEIAAKRAAGRGRRGPRSGRCGRPAGRRHGMPCSLSAVARRGPPVRRPACRRGTQPRAMRPPLEKQPQPQKPRRPRATPATRRRSRGRTRAHPRPAKSGARTRRRDEAGAPPPGRGRRLGGEEEREEEGAQAAGGRRHQGAGAARQAPGD